MDQLSTPSPAAADSAEMADAADSAASIGPGTRTPFASAAEAEAAVRFGMWLFLISLAALFGATVVGYGVMYVQLSGRGDWPEDLPHMPSALLLSTIILVVTSIGLERAARSARRGADLAARADAGAALMLRRVRRDLIVALAMGLAFLLLQAMTWMLWLRDVSWLLQDDGARGSRFALTSFWVLTGLHAAHVIGGALPLAFESWCAFRADRLTRHRAGTVGFTAMYWHFLGGIWLVLYAALLVTT
ncbi:MAG: heme-copper oxidase subunit III [Phycisphaerales bacterium]